MSNDDAGRRSYPDYMTYLPEPTSAALQVMAMLVLTALTRSRRRLRKV